MFQKLFNPENPLMITLTQITDCVFLSMFFFLGSVPVITLGASAAALYDGVYRAYRCGDKHSWGRFLNTYKSCLKQSLLPTAVVLGVLGVLGWAMIQIWNAAVLEGLSWMIFSGAALGAVAAAGILSVVFPMLSRFENPTGRLLKNSLILGLANLPRTLALGLVNILGAWLCLRYIFPVFFLPALTALIGTLFLEPMFRPYLSRETEQTSSL